MFAGLPGIGVGMLFYVLVALWMPIQELGRLLRGDFSAARWRLVMVQCCFASSIIASIAIADRILSVVLTAGTLQAITPARLINEGFASQVPASIWAAPIMASMLLLSGVLLAVQALRVLMVLSSRPQLRTQESLDRVSEAQI